MVNRIGLTDRIGLLHDLGLHMSGNDPEWATAKDSASAANAWFTAEHISIAITNIVNEYLNREKLQQWVDKYTMPQSVNTVGLVMAGNIPLVGFHDLLCGFVCGHNLMLKLSSKDEVLMRYIVQWLIEKEASIAGALQIADRLNNCDAYIATGSNNTARYFEQYFGKYPHIIRKNRTSVAVLDGTETDEELALLADDVYMYYGLGCRNVTQVCVPKGYNFERLLNIFRKYDHYADLNKYKNNYDYHLAIYLLNRVPYMSNESLLLVENNLVFSAVSVLHYRYYDDKAVLLNELKTSPDIQAIIGDRAIPFGGAQRPALDDYADGVDTMSFLSNL